MKYYLIENDIIKSDAQGNPTWTDEPLWLRNEIDTWKERFECGGRMWCTTDARRSVIISPVDLEPLAPGPIEEISEETFSTYIALAFPERTQEIDGEIIVYPTPSLERVCSVFWSYAANHTGAIAANESWTVANNDHHITGNITINANVVVTWDAGINVYFDGAYSITLTAGSGGTTTLTAVGTAALPITMEANASRTNTGVTSFYTPFATAPNNSAMTLQYFVVRNCVSFYTVGTPTSHTATIDHITFYDSASFITVAAGYNLTQTFGNIYAIRGTISGAFISTPASLTGTATLTLNDCQFSTISSVFTGSSTSTGTFTITCNDCFFVNTQITASGNQLPIGCVMNFNRCVFHNASGVGGAATGTKNYTFVDCIFYGRGGAFIDVISGYATGVITATTCDFLKSRAATNYAVANASSTTVTLTSCYISGMRTADDRNYYTGSETPAQVNNTGAGAITVTTGRTTRNFPFTASSISTSSIGTKTATISWTGAFRTINAVKIGTASGVYNEIITKDGSWANADGQGQMQASPSFSFTRLSPGTTYYYRTMTWDWVYEQWNLSAEQSFTTLSAPIAVGFIG